MKEVIKDVILGDQVDTWRWEVGSDGNFTVSQTRQWIDKHLLTEDATTTRWNKIIPRKVNIMIWRANRDRLPNRPNLLQKGIETPFVLCLICG
ncbi:hypothetical protein LXL04_023158 [Taraxacum kok-saghyz]